MSIRAKIGIVVGILAAIAGLSATALFKQAEPIVLQGAVVLNSARPEQQAPLAGVEVTATAAGGSAVGRSDANGLFSLTLPRTVRVGSVVTLRFADPEHRPFEMEVAAGRELPIARMTAIAPPPPPPQPSQPSTAVANMRVRYSIAEPKVVNIGTGVKMFETPNRANVPCDGREPCSPDGRWKAGIGAASLDAGPDNRFRNARVSCIAGPCPFTRIDVDNFSAGGQRIGVTVRDWSDTATFVLQAEVVRVEMSDVVRYVYPVVLGRTMNFTLPAAAEGPSIEAEINGTPIVFPLGPRLTLSWAACDSRSDKDQSKVYRCELKPAFRFQ